MALPFSRRRNVLRKSGRLPAPYRPDRALVSALVTQGLLVFLGSQDSTRAVALLEEALALAGRQHTFAWKADCPLRLSEIIIQQGNYEQARQMGLKALKTTRRFKFGGI